MDDIFLPQLVSRNVMIERRADRWIKEIRIYRNALVRVCVFV